MFLFVGGTAPDVFTNHLAKYPEYASKKVILDIEPLVKRDNVDTKMYLGELANLWTREGKRFGLGWIGGGKIGVSRLFLAALKQQAAEKDDVNGHHREEGHLDVRPALGILLK